MDLVAKSLNQLHPHLPRLHISLGDQYSDLILYLLWGLNLLAEDMPIIIWARARFQNIVQGTLQQPDKG